MTSPEEYGSGFEEECFRGLRRTNWRRFVQTRARKMFAKHSDIRLIFMIAIWAIFAVVLIYREDQKPRRKPTREEKLSGAARINGHKVRGDGSWRDFPGNTVISFLKPNSVFAKALATFHEKLAQSALGKHLAILPPDSYHVTIADGMNQASEDRTRLFLTATLDSITRQMHEKGKDLFAKLGKKKLRFTVREVVLGERHVTVWLDQPATSKEADEMKEEIVKLYGFDREEWFKTDYHVTLAYVYQPLDQKPLDPEESSDSEDEDTPAGGTQEKYPTATLSEELKKILPKGMAVEVEAPAFAVFQKMDALYKYPLSRDDRASLRESKKTL